MIRAAAAVALAGALVAGPARAAAPAAFVHASGTELVDGAGIPLRLQGVNLGGWLIWESYLMGVEGDGWTESRLKRALVETAGRSAAYRFFRDLRAAAVTEADLDRIAALGWNTVRLPINANLLGASAFFDVEPGEGWAIVDRLVNACAARGLFVVLDLHSAPGGQNGGGISDSELRKGLWEGPDAEANQAATVALWRAIAARYRDRTTVAAYDLLNEPVVPKEDGGTAAVGALYRRIVAAIREVDPNHLLMVEGNWYATDLAGLGLEGADPNLCYQFHKYWNEPSPVSIRGYLDLRDRARAPLWLGETGENNARWYARCVELMGGAGIGWCFWPWKRIGGGCVASVTAPEAWKRIGRELGRRPADRRMSADAIRRGLAAYVAAVKLAACREDAGTVAALAGRLRETVRIPGELAAADYARCRTGHRGNRGGAARGGDADLYDEGKGRVAVRGLEPGETLAYDVTMPATDRVRPVFVSASGWLEVAVDGATLAADGAPVAAGTHEVVVTARSSGAGFASLALVATPGRIAAADFLGGQGTGYWDSTAGNKGGAYRTDEAVDVEACAEGGFDVGWIEDGEWLTWRVEGGAGGAFDLLVRCSSLAGGGRFDVTVDGRRITAGVAVPMTGWWQTWTDLTIPGVRLAPGSHTMRLDARKGGFNLAYFLFLPRRGG